MFPARSLIRRWSSRRSGATRFRPSCSSAPGALATLRLAGLTVVLAAALARGGSAQALGTMQVTARVLPAKVSWTAVEEAGRVARALLLQPGGGPRVKGGRLVRTRGELVMTAGGSRTLRVTIQHPYN
jgi:hypothetical protein